MKEIKIECPCCDALLVVDVRTAKVLRHVMPAELDEFGKPIRGNTARWDAASAKIEAQKARGTDAFDAALEKEKARDTDLDALFDRARAKVDERRKEHDD